MRSKGLSRPQTKEGAFWEKGEVGHRQWYVKPNTDLRTADILLVLEHSVKRRSGERDELDGAKLWRVLCHNSSDFILNSVESHPKFPPVDWWSQNYILESNEEDFSSSNGENGQEAIETG